MLAAVERSEREAAQRRLATRVGELVRKGHRREEAFAIAHAELTPDPVPLDVAGERP
jgi:hypothetical protein